MELSQLIREESYAVTPERQRELTELSEKKFVDLIDSLSLLDKVCWNSRARASSA